MKFRIEQIALCPSDPEAAIELLTAMGAGEWAKDVVVAKGSVRTETRKTNVANLAFEYEMLKDAKELEVLHYRAGENWMERSNRVSHIGMHCSEQELNSWKRFFGNRNIYVVQEVKTESHSNPAIAGQRWYHYCIFDTFDILGVDVKFIVRKEEPPL